MGVSLTFKTLYWEDQRLVILDQTLLPQREVYVRLNNEEDVAHAIQSLQVRGAPAIGVAAAYGVYLGVKRGSVATNWDKGLVLKTVCDFLIPVRPTAVNLAWAVNRMRAFAQTRFSSETYLDDLLQEAKRIHEEDVTICQAIGDHGQHLIQQSTTVLTHCNAGALATAGCGTALAPIYCAAEQGRELNVFVDETRPVNQGARLTLWELSKIKGVNPTLIVDSAAASVLRSGKVDLVIVGADRVARNGDTANKIGTLSVALAAKASEVPFFVAAPLSTFDGSLSDGGTIIIEDRKPWEVLQVKDWSKDVRKPIVFNPAFDVTPADLITGFITEYGIIPCCHKDDPDFVQTLQNYKQQWGLVRPKD